MAKLTPEEKEQIVKKYLPGYKLVRDVEADDRSPDDQPAKGADAGTPDFRALKQKYFGTTGDVADSVAADASPNDDDDDEIVQVEPERRASPLDRGSRAKSIVISGEKVKGSQG